MADSRNGLKRLQLLDYSDRELLLLVMDEADRDPNGFADTLTIAEALGITGKFRLNSVSGRLTVLRRLGAVDKDHDVPASALTRWTVTPMGRMLATGKMNAQLAKRLEGLPAEQILALTRVVAEKYRTAPETAGALMRREFRFGTGLTRV
jgi:hypothetical protein